MRLQKYTFFPATCIFFLIFYTFYQICGVNKLDKKSPAFARRGILYWNEDSLFSGLGDHAADAETVGEVTRNQFHGAASGTELAGVIDGGDRCGNPDVGAHVHTLVAVKCGVVETARQHGEASAVGSVVRNPSAL